MASTRNIHDRRLADAWATLQAHSREGLPLDPDASRLAFADPEFLLRRETRGIRIPAFRGEIEARVQADGVLRLAGRFRRRFSWREGRVKIALRDVVHAQVKGSQVELWLRGADDAARQQLALELFTPEAANEFVSWLPVATLLPAAAVQELAAGPGRASPHALWMAAISVISVAMVVGVVLVVVLHGGHH